MSAHAIGEVALTISTLLYFIWFLPQIRLTFKRKSTSGLSLWMHGLLVAGYLADLVYGFGREMPLQYRLVTISGLGYLAIEHFQFWKYGLKKLTERRLFYFISLFFIIFFSYAIIVIFFTSHTKFFYDMAGMISNFCWFTFFIPQIFRNYLNKSSAGLSLNFVLISILTSVCDAISTYALNYDWPSKYYMPISLALRFIVFGQAIYYRFKPKNFSTLRPI